MPLQGTRPSNFPEVLPGGKRILFTRGTSAFATVPVVGGEVQIFAKLSSEGSYAPAIIGSGGTLLQVHAVPAGYLVYGQSPG